MQPAEIVCANCGWHNEPPAMMCGGCGRPLRSVAARMAPERSTIDLEDTLPDIPVVEPHTTPTSAIAVPKPRSPQPTQPTERRLHRRLLTGCLVTLAILLAVAIGTWVVIIRPVAHTIVDHELRNTLEGATSQVPVFPPGTISVTEAQINQLLAGHNFGRVPIRQTTAKFRGGAVNIIYALPITGGTVTTKLVARNGRLFAEDTHVEGLAGLIETGDELQVTLNDALALLPQDDSFGSVTAQNGTLSVTIVPKK
jgi:hypothetical protein